MVDLAIFQGVIFKNRSLPEVEPRAGFDSFHGAQLHNYLDSLGENDKIVRLWLLFYK
jgi:hypothetical protein